MTAKVTTAQPTGAATLNRAARRTRKPLPILPNLDQFPETGYSLWRDAQPFVRRSREWVRLKEKAGLFPLGIRVSQNEVMWANAELKRFLRDPLNYRAPEAADTATAIAATPADTTPPAKALRPRTKRAAVALVPDAAQGA